MQSFLYVSPEPTEGGTGGGPEDDPRFPRVAFRAQGFMSVAFGFALGLTFLAFLGILHIIKLPTDALEPFIASANPWLIFIFGFIAGTLISGIYNILVIRRLNLFGLEHSAD
ncbi:MAG: hypothetical protein GWN00_37970 [Aliifodinibius sp.]|nr:hypothetical protein [candidate division KSB1 bacterium]NIT61785.1 hypothetical protein [Fodinibius sp.]NIS28088.1 hypothetical protein [candidate division KSB1 bacterium]NIU28768.1 hypothetical protein [candidate division KSB1 bacterium]NIU92944.1 hypothetical protein [candidate division KSB1 bacterium]